MIEFLHDNKEVEKALNRAFLAGLNEGIDRQQRINIGMRTAPSSRKSVVKKLMKQLNEPRTTD